MASRECWRWGGHLEKERSLALVGMEAARKIFDVNASGRNECLERKSARGFICYSLFGL